MAALEFRIHAYDLDANQKSPHVVPKGHLILRRNHILQTNVYVVHLLSKEYISKLYCQKCKTYQLIIPSEYVQEMQMEEPWVLPCLKCNMDYACIFK